MRLCTQLSDKIDVELHVMEGFFIQSGYIKQCICLSDSVHGSERIDMTDTEPVGRIRHFIHLDLFRK